MKTYTAIAEQLYRLGVRDAFTFTAEDIVDIVAELNARGVHVHHTRHEHAAVGMADGYSRASGRLGVALIGGGVGLTNSMNAVLTAAKAHSRVLVITCDAPGGNTHAARIQRKHVDHRGLLDITDVRHVDCAEALMVPGDVVRAVRAAMDGGDPVVLNVPDEIMREESGEPLDPAVVAAPERRPLADDDRDTLLALLTGGFGARRVVILAGRGAVKGGARDALLKLGERTGALMANTMMAKSIFAASPYNAGVSGNFATPVASELLGTADLVLAFGASLNFDTTYDGAIFGKARVIHIDNRDVAFGRFLSPDLTVLADARLAAESLTAALDAAGHTAEEGFRTPETAARLAGYRLDATFTDKSAAGAIDPRTLMTILDRHLPRERCVVVDGGSQKKYPVRYLSVPDPEGYIWMTEHGAIGCGLGGALGAAVARPDRLTVLCIGDGALMMTLHDLDTAARYKLPLLVVVSNNLGLAAEYNKLVKNGFPGEQVMYDNPSFEALGKVLGLAGHTIATPADLERLPALLKDLHGPAILDCRVTMEVLEEPSVVYARVRATKKAASATA